MGITKINGKKEINDKFYTKPEIALECIKQIDLYEFDLIIEPSAGNGSFSNQIPNCLSYDLLPEDEKIQKQDFLKLDTEIFLGKKVLTIGNPPFGVQNNLAIKFFNKSAEYSNTIAFILPKTFKKDSIQNKLNLYFHLEKEIDIPKNSFLLNGENYNVNCVFQIWVRKSFKRKINRTTEDEIIRFVKPTQKFDFYIRRVGGNCGKAYFLNGELPSKQSNYFVINQTNIPNTILVDIINDIQKDCIEYSVGPRSISKDELINLIKHKLDTMNSINENANRQSGFDFEKTVERIFENFKKEKNPIGEFDGYFLINGKKTYCQIKHQDNEKENIEFAGLSRNKNKKEPFYLIYGFDFDTETKTIDIHFSDNITKRIEISFPCKTKDIYIYYIEPDFFKIEDDCINKILKNVDNHYTKYMDLRKEDVDKNNEDIFPHKNETSSRTIGKYFLKKEILSEDNYFFNRKYLNSNRGFVVFEKIDGYITHIPLDDNGTPFKNVEDVPDYYDAIIKIDNTKLTDKNWDILSKYLNKVFKENNNKTKLRLKRDHKDQFRIQCCCEKKKLFNHLVNYDKNILNLKNKIKY